MNLRLRDKVVLITGGTGSLGNSLVIRLFEYGVSKVIIYSRGEYNQWIMEKSFKKGDYPIRYFLGDIRDKDRLYRAFGGVDIIIHCAAIKHIDKAQYDPFEAIKTNTIGAQNIIDAAIDCNVDRVMAISTDKAVNPTSLYGASKLASDFMFVAANNYSPERTKFSVIRFGNFWNSSGSIIEFLFKQCRVKNAIIPLTDERMTRFFITLGVASDYVIEAIDIMKGQEIFTPKMSSRKMIDIMNFICISPKFRIIGMRPGEKLHEELIVSEYSRQTYETNDWFITYPIGYEGSIIGNQVPEGFIYNSETALIKAN